MDIQNHFYGHSAALALAAGLRRPRHIPGLLQHGWTAVSPAGVHTHNFPQVGVDERWTLFVWSHSSRAWSPEGEPRATTAIGSPFLYLAREAAAAGWKPTELGRSVWIPFHGTRLMRVRGDHVALAREAADHEGPCTVCLHVEDASDPQIVAAWTAAGHELVTAGRRNDPDFLARILAVIGPARRVASNRLSTAVMYAAALGKQVAVYGPPLTLGGDEARTVDQIRDTWPELHGRSTDVELTMPLAAVELGGDALLPAAELRAALGWDHALRMRPAGYYWLASSVRKAGTVLGVAARSDTTGLDESTLSPWAFLKHPLSHLPAPLPRRVPCVPELAAPVPVRSV